MSLQIKQSLSLLFLAFFLMTKMAGFHVLTHDDSDLSEDCAICQVLISDSQTLMVLDKIQEFTPTPEIVIPQEPDFLTPKVFLTSDRYSYYLFSRPPPSI